MQLPPMVSSPDGLISAWYAVITKTPGWELLTTTSNVAMGGGYPPTHTLCIPAFCTRHLPYNTMGSPGVN